MMNKQSTSSHQHQPEARQELLATSPIHYVGLPDYIAEPTTVTYRSVGIGIFGATMRFLGMPLEKMALYMNSSQVTGKNQLAQAIRLTFQEGALAPYKVVGPASMTAWFLQYSVMGVAFQMVDHGLSELLGVKPVYYGAELMEPAPTHKTSGASSNESLDSQAKSAFKNLVAPFLAAALESKVSNRAEVQRFFGGPAQYAALEQSWKRMPGGAFAKLAGPAFGANAMRNVIMCNTSFLLTPMTYKLYFPQEHKSVSSLFWYGLGMNIFIGNVLAITQQALWGRSLDYLAQHGQFTYRQVIHEGLQKEGIKAFWTGPKWFSRVLMNAPAQGTLPWFYNEVLPLGEPTVLEAVKVFVYEPFLKEAHELELRAMELERKAVELEQRAVDSLKRRATQMTISTSSAATGTNETSTGFAATSSR